MQNITNQRQMKQLNFDQAWIFFIAGQWKKWDLEKLLHFQLYQKYLCVGVSRLQEACRKYGIAYAYGQKQLFVDRKKQKIKFYKKTGRKNGELEDFVSPKMLKLLKKPVFEASKIVNQHLIKKHEQNNVTKKSTKRHSNRRLAHKRNQTLM